MPFTVKISSGLEFRTNTPIQQICSQIIARDWAEFGGETMDLDRISGLKVEELKNFLRLRGLKVSRRKEELVTRVFVAIENDVPLQKTAEEVEQEIATECETK